MEWREGEAEEGRKDAHKNDNDHTRMNLILT